jgi:hypothetical protein
LVLVVTALDDGTAEAEFHLKTDFVYDLRMREGRVTLAHEGATPELPSNERCRDLAQDRLNRDPQAEQVAIVPGQRIQLEPDR